MENFKPSIGIAAMPKSQAFGLGHWELPLVLLFAWLAFASVPIYLGNIGLSWDGLNHQIYLGWVANQPRFDKDYMAASLQAYQFPYLYWPAYKLAISGFDGRTAGIVLSTLHLIAVPPVWMIARVLMPEISYFGVFMRFSAVTLAFMSAVSLKLLEATGNDVLAAAPFLWALAFALEAVASLQQDSEKQVTRYALWSGFLGGVAVACKLSNGPLALLLPLVFMFCNARLVDRARWAIFCSVAVLVGFALSYGYWGYQLWVHFGNPLYPFYDRYFEPVRAAMGWHR